MTEYNVSWKITVEADNEIAAARKAREIQLDYKSHAVLFEVTPNPSDGTGLSVDLLDHPED